jgi:hypothetical protein
MSPDNPIKSQRNRIIKYDYDDGHRLGNTHQFSKNQNQHNKQKIGYIFKTGQQISLVKFKQFKTGLLTANNIQLY